MLYHFIWRQFCDWYIEMGKPRLQAAERDPESAATVRSVLADVLRDLLPHATGPEFTVRWAWQPGDIVVWDNRCTLHAGTGFDHERYSREMWRLTLVS